MSIVSSPPHMIPSFEQSLSDRTFAEISTEGILVCPDSSGSSQSSRPQSQNAKSRDVHDNREVYQQ